MQPVCAGAGNESAKGVEGDHVWNEGVAGGVWVGLTGCEGLEARGVGAFSGPRLRGTRGTHTHWENSLHGTEATRRFQV